MYIYVYIYVYVYIYIYVYGRNGKVYISSPPGYDEDPLYVYCLLKPFYGMPCAARAWHTSMSASLAKKGCAMVGFKDTMWTVTIDGASY